MAAAADDASVAPAVAGSSAATAMDVEEGVLQDETCIDFRQENPKQANSKAWHRYNKYKVARTVKEALHLGAERTDLSNDLKKGFFRIQKDAGTKRQAAQGTPDKEAQARSHVAPAPPGAVGRKINFSELPAGSTLQAPPGTGQAPFDQAVLLQAMEAMVQRTIKSEIGGLEKTVGAAFAELRESVEEVRTNLAQERRERQESVRELADRLSTLEVARGAPQSSSGTRSEKVFIVGGFGNVTKAEAIKTVSTALDEVPGFVEATARGNVPAIVKAHFETADSLADFLTAQKEVESFSGLFATRDTPWPERRWNKALNKIKRAACEVDLREGADVVIDRDKRVVYCSRGGKLIEMATVGEDATIDWKGEISEEAQDSVAELLKR